MTPVTLLRSLRDNTETSKNIVAAMTLATSVHCPALYWAGLRHLGLSGWPVLPGHGPETVTVSLAVCPVWLRLTAALALTDSKYQIHMNYCCTIHRQGQTCAFTMNSNFKFHLKASSLSHFRCGNCMNLCTIFKNTHLDVLLIHFNGNSLHSRFLPKIAKLYSISIKHI